MMTKVVPFPSRIPDAEERAQALDIHASWIVEAPAGSGKTGLLIQRYLKLLGDASVTEPEQIMAITFTVRATVEMRDRVLSELDAAQSRSPVESEDFARMTRSLAAIVLARNEELGWNLLEQPQRMRIRTIDSLSSEIAGSLPLLSGSGGSQTRAAVPDALHRAAAQQTLMLLGGKDSELHDALRTLLRHRDGNLTECERLIANMLWWREQWGKLIPLGRLEDTVLEQEVRPQLEHALEQIVCEGLAAIAERFPRAALNKLTTLAAEMALEEGYKDAPSPIEMCAGLRTSPGAAAKHLEHWRMLIHLLVTPSSQTWRKSLNVNIVKFAITAAQKQQLKAIVDAVREDEELLGLACAVAALPPARYPKEQWDAVKALFRILQQAMVELKLLFAEREECDYTEVTLAAQTALEHDNGATEYAEALGMKLQHLLVDEMQDTSLSQYRLIEMLTQGWDGSSQTLFLVGDPKQSIYLFRQARVEHFLRTMKTKKLGDLPLGVLRLTANFRSQQKLVEQFNADFSKIFTGAGPEYAGDVPYVRAEAVRDANAVEGVVWHPLTEGESDAAKIREIVQWWRAYPLPMGRAEPWRIAVLVRARAHLDAMVGELKRAGIPYRAVNVEALADRQEVLDVLALTRALLHPADRVAWFAVLRAPWCGLGRTDLLALAGGDDYDWAERSMEDAIAARGELLSEDGCLRLERIWPVLEKALSKRKKMRTSQWVERTWRSLGGDAYATAEELANVQYYLQLLDKVEQNGFLDMDLLKEMMNKLYAAPAATPDAVDLMTIHGAKGLEWDVVIVPALEKKTRSSRSSLMNWVELDMKSEEAAQVLLAPIHGAGEDSDALNEWIRSVRKARDAAERKRLYYVACTRAKMSLHLFAAPKQLANGSLSPHPESLLRAAWPAVKELFTEAVTPIQEEGEVLAIAAEEETSPPWQPQRIWRLPLSFDRGERFRTARRLWTAADTVERGTFFDRPEGSFAARALGNAVHAFLEVLAGRIAGGATPESLLLEVAGWKQRVEAVVRGMGVAPGSVKKIAAATLRGLENTLRDAAGRWVLATHAEAQSEQTLELGERTLRLDRSFLAGAEAMSFGESHLWIVDFKTGEPGGRDAEAYFAAEREAYRPQMETYAAAYADAGRPVRLALYYPLASRLELL